jgi:putative transcriptional regulator
MTAGEIRKLRERLGLSRADFGKAIGVSVSCVSAWERGERKPSGPARKLMERME